MADPPYGVIWKALERGEVIPFLGAGASVAGRSAGTPWDPKSHDVLPTGTELAHALAEEASFPSSDARDRDDLAKVASYYADVSGRTKLRRCLHELLAGQRAFGPLHALLAAAPAPLLIVATNYDMLLEQAFEAVKRPFDLVVYSTDRKEYANALQLWRHGEPGPQPVQPNKLDVDLTKTSVIFKIHGSVGQGDRNEWDSFVITEEDYVEFLSRMTTNTAVPPVFLDHFSCRSFLFLGYSLRDWNLRVVLRNLQSHFWRRAVAADPNVEIPPSWAIQLRPSEVECALWARRNVNIYDVSLDTFVEQLRKKGEQK